MGQREDMLLALGVDPTAGVAPPPVPTGVVDVLKEQAAQRADALRALVAGTGAKLVSPTTNPVLRAAYSQANPIAAAALQAGAGMAAEGMHDGISKRALQYASGEAPPREPVSFQRTRDAEPSPLKPQNTPLAYVQPAPPLRAPGFAPGIMGGGGGGPDFGGLEKGLRDAQGRQLAGYDAAADLQRQLGVDVAGRRLAVDDMAEADALSRQRDAEDQMRIEAETAQRHQAFLDRQEELANDIAKERVDPRRLLSNADLGEQITYGIGAALGGGNAMLNGNNGNTYLDRIDKLIDRDINAQLTAIESKRASYNARNSLFGQMLAESGDRRLAAMQTKKFMYDAIDMKMRADADRLGIPELRTNAEIAGQVFQEKKSALDVQIQQTALQQARAAAAAAVAAQRAAEERAWQHQKDLIQLDQEQQKIDVEGRKADATKGAANKEQQTAQNELNAGITELAEARKNIKHITAGTMVGTAAAKSLPAWVPGITGARNNMNTRNDYNIRAKMLVGAAYKLGTDSQEPKRMELIDEYSKPYVIGADDNEETAQKKIDDLQHLLVTKARAKEATPGANAPGFVPDGAKK